MTPNPKYSGLQTDLYELTMAAGYLETGFDARATFELFVRSLPPEEIIWLPRASIRLLISWKM